MYSCIWFDGQVADGRPVLVVVESDRVVLFDPEFVRYAQPALAEIPLSQLAIEPRSGAVPPLVVVVGTDQSLEHTPPELVAALAKVRPQPRGAMRAPLLWPWVGAAVALAVMVQLGMRPLSSALVSLVPDDAFRLLKMEALDELERHEADAKNHSIANLARRLGAPPDLEIEVVNDFVVNAYSLPDNTIAVTDALVCEAESPSELAGVIAHELGHLHYRHVEASWLRSHLFRLVSRAPASLSALAMGRDDEREADAYAKEALTRAGISQNGIRDFFRRQRKPSYVDLGMLSTHPGDAERIESFGQDTIDKGIGMPPIEWQRLRAAYCHAELRLPQHADSPDGVMANKMGSYYIPAEEMVPGQWGELCVGLKNDVLRPLKVSVTDKRYDFGPAKCDSVALFGPGAGVDLSRRRSIVPASPLRAEAGGAYALYSERYSLQFQAGEGRDHCLMLAVNQREQCIYALADDEAEDSFVVEWAGDLDGDRRLDLLISNGTDLILYRSGAGGDAIVTAAARAPAVRAPQDKTD